MPVNKSDAIRDAIVANARLKPSEIVKLLAEKGIKVSGNLVYAIKAKAGAKRRKAKRQKAMAVVTSSSSNGDPVALIRDVRSLADRAGGIKNLKELVEILAQ